MAEQSGDYLSRLQEYKQRLDGLADEARGQVERQAPDALDKMATTARNIAQLSASDVCWGPAGLARLPLRPGRARP
jgi:hypothetical protein